MSHTADRKYTALIAATRLDEVYARCERLLLGGMVSKVLRIVSGNGERRQR